MNPIEESNPYGYIYVTNSKPETAAVWQICDETGKIIENILDKPPTTSVYLR